MQRLINMQFIIASRREIERGIVVRTPYVVISISDPSSRKPRLKRSSGFRGAIYLRFHDVEPVTSAEPAVETVLMTAKHARRVWNFILRHWESVDTVVVHCEQGSSRSPAVVAGIADVMDYDVSELLRWLQPNAFVVRLMRSVGNDIMKERKSIKTPELIPGGFESPLG